MKQLTHLIACMLLSLMALVVPNSLAQDGVSNSGKLESAVREILSNGDVSAGLEIIDGCGVKESKVLTPPAGNTEERLNNIMQSDKVLSWSRINDKSYRATIRYSPDIQLTSIRVPPKHIEARTLMLATDLLLSDASVRSELVRLGYTYYPGEIGFSPIHTELRVIDLPAGTVGDDLMVLAEKFGPSAWQVKQHTCGNSRTFRVDWIKR
jgi:hypothetical protein